MARQAPKEDSTVTVFNVCLFAFVMPCYPNVFNVDKFLNTIHLTPQKILTTPPENQTSKGPWFETLLPIKLLYRHLQQNPD